MPIRADRAQSVIDKSPTIGEDVLLDESSAASGRQIDVNKTSWAKASIHQNQFELGRVLTEGDDGRMLFFSGTYDVGSGADQLGMVFVFGCPVHQFRTLEENDGSGANRSRQSIPFTMERVNNTQITGVAEAQGHVARGRTADGLQDVLRLAVGSTPLSNTLNILNLKARIVLL